MGILARVGEDGGSGGGGGRGRGRTKEAATGAVGSHRSSMATAYCATAMGGKAVAGDGGRDRETSGARKKSCYRGAEGI